MEKSMNKAMTFNRLSQEASELLLGALPEDWYGRDEILR